MEQNLVMTVNLISQLMDLNAVIPHGMSLVLSCADLEANYNWDCSGCNCPGDGDSVCVMVALMVALMVVML